MKIHAVQEMFWSPLLSFGAGGEFLPSQYSACCLKALLLAFVALALLAEHVNDNVVARLFPPNWFFPPKVTAGCLAS